MASFKRKKLWGIMNALIGKKDKSGKLELSPLPDTGFNIEGVTKSDLKGNSFPIDFGVSVTLTWHFDENRPHTLPYIWKRKD